MPKLASIAAGLIGYIVAEVLKAGVSYQQLRQAMIDHPMIPNGMAEEMAAVFKNWLPDGQ